MDTIATICPFCGCGSGTYLRVNDEEVVGAYPILNHPINRGKLCIRGWWSNQYLKSPSRLKSPMIRKGESLKEVEWDEALDFCSSKLLEIRKSSGGHSLGVIGSPSLTNEDAFVLMKFARAILRTNTVDGSYRFSSSATISLLNQSLGLWTNGIASFDNLEKANAVIVIGGNIFQEFPDVVGARILKAKDNGAKIILIDPLREKPQRFVNIHLKPRPPALISLINAMSNYIIENGLSKFEAGKEYIKKIKGFAMEFPGIPTGAIEEATKIYAQSNNSAIVYCSDELTDPNLIRSLINLAILSGQINGPEQGLIPISRSPNLQGVCDMGLVPDLLSGYQDIDKEEAKAPFEKHWGVKLPLDKGLTVHEALDPDQKVKGLLIAGDDLLGKLPSPDLIKSLKEMEFIAVFDGFLTDTCNIAHVVFPIPPPGERNGTFTNLEGRVQRLGKIGDSKTGKPLWSILSQLSDKMKHPLKYASEQAIFEEIKALTPLYCQVSLNEKAGMFLPRKKSKPKLFIVDETPVNEPPRELPFSLIVKNTQSSWSRNTLVKASPLLKREYLEERTETKINPDDSKSLGLRPGDKLKITSKDGEVVASVGLDNSVVEGTVVFHFHFVDSISSLLGKGKVDPQTKGIYYKDTFVRVGKA